MQQRCVGTGGQHRDSPWWFQTLTQEGRGPHTPRPPDHMQLPTSAPQLGAIWPPQDGAHTKITHPDATGIVRLAPTLFET